MKQNFKVKCTEIVTNTNELCDIILDICYYTNNSKQFAWDIVGDVMIRNLAEHNSHKIKYLEINPNGTVEYCGEHFTEKVGTI